MNLYLSAFKICCTMVILLRISEALEATCETKLSDLKHSITKVICPADCWKQHTDLCGTDDYASGPLCLAAMHAGLMDNFGGYFEVFKSDPLSNYRGVPRFGVTSKSCRSSVATYSFQMKCSTKGNSELSVTDVVCPSGCSSNYVCGTQLYNSNSSVCAAAIHAGILNGEGGHVRFFSKQSQTHFQGSTNYGVTSKSCGFSERSFSFTDEDTCPSRNCLNEGKCQPGTNQEFCFCPAGVTGEDCQIDINECTNGTHNCHQHATCNNTVGSFQCSCNANYTGNGTHCVPNFCASNPGLCKNAGSCADTSTHYSCSCTAGYTGIHCEKDINECTSGTHNCHRFATCTNFAGSCSCNANYAGNGRYCASYFCNRNPSLCQHGGTCTNTQTYYSCACTVWYQGSNCQTVRQNHIITSTNMDWGSSRGYCQSLGGDLATWGMRDAATRQSIIDNMLRSRTGHFWIGMTDVQSEGNWIYIDGVGAWSGNTDFAKGEPNNKGGGGPRSDCGHLNRNDDFQMDDLNCDYKQMAICERTL